MTIPQIWDAVRDYFFLAPLRLNMAVVFEEAQQLRELWFDGELGNLFEEMRKSGRIKSFKRGPRAHGGNCDFKLELLDGTSVVIEVKADYQRPKPPRKKDWEVKDRAVDYAKPGNIPKMLTIPATSHFLLLFAYPDRDDKEWNRLMAHLPIRLRIEGFPHITVSRARVDHSPQLSIGWLHCF